MKFTFLKDICEILVIHIIVSSSTIVETVKMTEEERNPQRSDDY